MDRTLSLVSAGPQDDVVDNFGMTPLHYAVMRGFTDVVRTLLGRGFQAQQTQLTSNSVIVDRGLTEKRRTQSDRGLLALLRELGGSEKHFLASCVVGFDLH